MIEIDIPGYRRIRLEHLVLDYNGTIAEDGKLIAGVSDIIRRLSSAVEIHILTADTFGGAFSHLHGLPCRCEIIPAENQGEAKSRYVVKLGRDSVCAVGNGRNDLIMLKEAALGIAVVQKEGAWAETVASAQVVCTDIIWALELLLNPLRLIATLRS